jgi:predicted ATPase
MRKPYLRSAMIRPELVEDPRAFPLDLPAVRALDRLVFHPDVTFLVGENGSGKSTILEALAINWGFNPEGGSINLRYEGTATHSALHRCLRTERSIDRPLDGYFLRAESFYNVITEMNQIGVPIGGRHDPGDYHARSHGEAFLALMLNRFRGRGLYFLDEPEAALSPARQLAVLRRIHHLVEEHSQFVIATHSPILMAYPRASIYQLDEDGITKVDYKSTEHYIITREFLTRTDRMLADLMADDEEDGPAM